MRTVDYPSTSIIKDPDAAPASTHRMFWWTIKVVSGTILIAALFLMVIYDIPVLFSIPRGIGQVLVISGATVSIWHYVLLKRQGSNMCNPQTLMTHRGLFRWIRHPMYLADMVSYTGLFLLMPNPVTAVILPLSLIALVRQSQEEDRFLRQRFAGEFKAWRSKTSLLVPAIY